MVTIEEVRKNNEIWDRSVCDYVERALLKYAADHSNFSYQSIKEMAYLINTDYSTRVSNVDLTAIAEGISTISDIKNRLNKGDISLVNEISEFAHKKSGSIKTYPSFASKFCYMYNRDKFPIYDSIAKNILYELNTIDKFTNVKILKSERLSYDKYVQVYKDFQNHYGLQEFSFWQIDKFLWVKGKQNEGGFASETFVSIS